MRTSNEIVTACLGLGSNLGDPPGNVREAIERLRRAPGVLSVAASSLYATDPVGVTGQPKFVNACARVTTDLPPDNLLAALLSIERAMGRVRGERWGPRVIDLDLLLYGDRVIDRAGLIVPHPEMHRRAFVLLPLAEIAPDAVHPVLGRTIAVLAAELGDPAGVERLGEPPA
jgi:2-amino-4-hydroxy-6-hydroxymethyldihydropteridine diphosphokinase